MSDLVGNPEDRFSHVATLFMNKVHVFMVGEFVDGTHHTHRIDSTLIKAWPGGM